MKMQIENDVNKILMEKHGIQNKVLISDVVSVGLNRTCSVDLGKGWKFEHITYESLDKGVFRYDPEYIADLMVDKIHRFNKYAKNK